MLTSRTAVYRLPLGAPEPGGAGVQDGAGEGAAVLNAGGDGAAATVPLLLAGHEDEVVAVDGHGGEARFVEMVGATMDGNGCLWVADWVDDSKATLRRVDAEGNVSTILGDIPGPVEGLHILPNGYLAICKSHALHLLDLGLDPPRGITLAAAPSPPGSPRRTLPGDLGALLDRQPDGTADLEVVVGDTAFPVHRALLGARCDYFRQRLESGFSDGASARLSLPDADPAAFALLLRFLYTGAVDIPAALSRPVAELADRLLLPELCRDAQAQVLAEVGPESMVDAMLWAESRGPGFSLLLSELKAWHLEHYEEVLRQARSSLKRLAVESPDLMLELHEGLGQRSAKKSHGA
ncbi:hypothetical protein GPECTOR_6g894 [Gonium pectorale]|uniref:BTB domain-containing protein n=1 Tax=Gonium pectorale TaxID=33097 RepID=A0A150GW13_GONPE|nr:hypothetical protein GPECTOR_6g894 [Gonium pectorale]|eukprot:KXZ53975.1 hypothetical protein GPECTOR_6g894 [Gonium pectorale]